MARTQEHGPPGGPPPEVPTQTGGGGDDDGESMRAAIAEMAKQAVALNSGGRKAFILDDAFQLVPASLVGSWFHTVENDEVVWQGVVVAEPQPGVYLVQIDKLEPGVMHVQIIVGLREMLDDTHDWRFYDSEELAQNAYALWMSTRKE
jgi:hypothetical protein